MKRVLVITYYWPPSGGAGVQRWLKFVKYLPECGWEPVVLTVDPEYASYPVSDTRLEKDIRPGTRVLRTRSREIFNAYKFLYRKKSVPQAGFSDETRVGPAQKLARFIRGNLFIPDPRRGWNRFALREARAYISTEGRPDCIITTGPPQSTHLIGRKLRKEFGIPWVADFRDPWTDIYYYHQLYPVFPAHQINLHLERKVFREADLITTASPTFRTQFLNKHGMDPEKTYAITNGYDADDFRKLPQSSEDGILITYVGTLAASYPVGTFVRALSHLARERKDIRMRFVGSVADAIKKQMEVLPEGMLEYIPPVDHPRAIASMAESHILLLAIPDHHSGKGIIPGKLFEYLASGSLILGLGPSDGDPAGILQETGRGIMVDYHDEKGMLRALHTLVERSGEKTDDLHGQIESYSRLALCRQLGQIMDTRT